MHDLTSRSIRPSDPALSRLLPLADRVEALTRRTGRAFLARDAELAESLVAVDGEHDQLDSALTAAWSDLLGENAGSPRDVPASAELVHALETISNLAATICGHVVGLSSGEAPVSRPAIEKLAELVPDLLRDAVAAFRRNDPGSAAEVQKSSVTVDVCFAQTYLDLLQAVRQGGADWETARRLHAVTRALERIGDNASEIAARVRPAQA